MSKSFLISDLSGSDFANFMRSDFVKRPSSLLILLFSKSYFPLSRSKLILNISSLEVLSIAGILI